MPLTPMTPVELSSLAAVGFDGQVEAGRGVLPQRHVSRYLPGPQFGVSGLAVLRLFARSFLQRDRRRDRCPNQRLRAEEPN